MEQKTDGGAKDGQSRRQAEQKTEQKTELPVQNASHATAAECGVSPSLGLSHKCCKLSGPLPRGTTKVTSYDAVNQAVRHDESVWLDKLLEACFQYPPVEVGTAGSLGLSKKVLLECTGRGMKASIVGATSTKRRGRSSRRMKMMRLPVPTKNAPIK